MDRAEYAISSTLAMGFMARFCKDILANGGLERSNGGTLGQIGFRYCPVLPRQRQHDRQVPFRK